MARREDWDWYPSVNETYASRRVIQIPAGFDQELPEGLAGFRAHFFNVSAVSFRRLRNFFMSMHVFGRKPYRMAQRRYVRNSNLEYLRAEGDRTDHIDGVEDRHYSVHSGDGQIFDFLPAQRTGSFSPPTGGVFIGEGGKIPRRSGLDFCVKELSLIHI